MSRKYVLGIDQSTQGTKAVIFDESGTIIKRADIKHKQWINELGWVSHNLDEIYQNVILAVKKVVEVSGIDKDEIITVGISNQRETTAAWKRNGESAAKAVVWQCSRAKGITKELAEYGELIRKRTGLHLSPYFPAAKMAWLIRNTIKGSDYCLGTMDSWLVYRLTEGEAFKTDYSNASRTQLFNLHTLMWDEQICSLFGVSTNNLPEVVDSNSCFGETTFSGYLKHPVPIHSVVGDSHAALYGQGCHHRGMIKTTYGTGSSIMMNIGKEFKDSKNGLVTSLAWSESGEVSYVLEGNINYTGAVITWLHSDLQLMETPDELEMAAKKANPADTTVVIPAFSGLSAPYWNSEAKAMICGMSRMTGKNEVLKAAVESIAFQIEAVLQAMKEDSGITVKEIRVDGGPTKNHYLMQFQSDISDICVKIPLQEELSVIGAAYMAGIADGLYQKEVLFSNRKQVDYKPNMERDIRELKWRQWCEAIKMIQGI